MKKNCNIKFSEGIYLVKVVQNRVSVCKMLKIVPSAKRFLQNLADILQMGFSIIPPNFIDLGRQIPKLCKKFRGCFFGHPV